MDIALLLSAQHFYWCNGKWFSFFSSVTMYICSVCLPTYMLSSVKHNIALVFNSASVKFSNESNVSGQINKHMIIHWNTARIRLLKWLSFSCFWNKENPLLVPKTGSYNISWRGLPANGVKSWEHCIVRETTKPALPAWKTMLISVFARITFSHFWQYVYNKSIE